MDNLEYLNQISKSNRALKAAPAKPNGFAGLSIPKIIIGGIVGFLFLMAFGALLSNLNRKPTNLTKQLYTRTTTVEAAVSTYNSSVKSSQLRAIGSSLSSILSHSSRQLAAYLAGESSGKDDEALIPDKKTAAAEEALAQELNITLNNAKLNGILDRTYSTQLSLQVSLLLSLTSQLIARTKDAALLEILTPLYSSLNTIHSSLESYSSPS